MTIRIAQARDRAEHVRLRRALWPTYPVEQIQAEADEFWTQGCIGSLPTALLVVDRGDARLGGFVEVSLRPVADGCMSGPVGYIEGWYIDSDLRRQGLGGGLIRAAEQWAQAQGCTEMASDCDTENHTSFTAHTALGYQHTEKCILFRKALANPNSSAQRRDWIALLPVELSVSTALKLVTDPAAGGIDMFLGTTRAERNDKDQELVALHYEAYEEMALQQLQTLASKAREKWPIVRLAILHRLGPVNVGEPSVLIAVASPHRGESFDACRFLIDSLKAHVAIWKKEVWADGSGTWVHPEKR